MFRLIALMLCCVAAMPSLNAAVTIEALGLGTRTTTVDVDANGKTLTTIAERDANGRLLRWVTDTGISYLPFWDEQGRLIRMDVLPGRGAEPARSYLFAYDLATGMVSQVRVAGGETVALSGSAAERTLQAVLQQILGLPFTL